MQIVEKGNARKSIEISIILIICVLSSMINYCISQIAGAYLLPLTILPVALALIFSYSLPVHCLFLIGLLDDMLNNSPIGFYSMLYLSAAWIFAAQSKEFPSKRMPAITLVLLFFLVNVLTYRIW